MVSERVASKSRHAPDCLQSAPQEQVLQPSRVGSPPVLGSVVLSPSRHTSSRAVCAATHLLALLLLPRGSAGCCDADPLHTQAELQAVLPVPAEPPPPDRCHRRRGRRGYPYAALGRGLKHLPLFVSTIHDQWPPPLSEFAGLLDPNHQSPLPRTRVCTPAAPALVLLPPFPSLVLTLVCRMLRSNFVLPPKPYNFGTCYKFCFLRLGAPSEPPSRPFCVSPRSSDPALFVLYAHC